MIKIVLGRAHTGKSQVLMHELAEKCSMQKAVGERQQLLLVPEQFSHRSERQLAELGGAVLLNAEALSFSRLCSRVFAQSGGLSAPTLDHGGRILLLYRTMKECGSALQALKKTRIAFLESLSETLDESKAFCITPAHYYEASVLAEGSDRDKLHDLGIIFDAYDALLAQTALDPRDRLTLLAEHIRNTNYFQNKHIYFDGFTYFTGQELQVLKLIFTQASSVTIALTCDDLDADAQLSIDIFAQASKTALQLKQLAADCGQRLTLQHCSNQPTEFGFCSHLEHYLFSVKHASFKGYTPITLYQAEGAFSELEWIAAQICKLVQDEGYRYRDISVVCRDMSPYEKILPAVFRRYQIPLFFSQKSALMEQPVMVLISAAFSAIEYGYSYEYMFRYLKSGLSGAEQSMVDKLENYVLLWNIRGSTWSKAAAWNKHPRGFRSQWDEADSQLLMQLDEARREIIAPLERLRKSKAKTLAEAATDFYQFLENIALPARLEKLAQEQIAAGAQQQADETRQVWRYLCQGLDQCVAIAGETEGDMASFSHLLTLVLGRYELDTIPVSLDCVTVQEYSRLGSAQPHALFLIGADNASIPQAPTPSGVLSEEDRQLLNEAGAQLSPSSEMRMLAEMTMLYETCTSAKEQLTLSYVASGEQEPCFIWKTMQALFPTATVLREEDLQESFRLLAPTPALEVAARHPRAAQVLSELPQYRERLIQMRRSAVLERQRLRRETVQMLYGDTIQMSASRLERLKSCHFMDFMQHGLHAQPRNVVSFDAPLYGSFVHYVLEYVLRREEAITSSEGGNRLIDEAVNAYIQEQLGALSDYSARFQYLLLSQKNTVRAVVKDMLEELRRSKFRPIDFELRFGDQKQIPPLRKQQGEMQLMLSGFVDRVDAYRQNEQLYLRVMDYKTGTKAINWTFLNEGLGLQMLLYLFALEEKGGSYFQAPISPAGVVYVPARDPIVDGAYTMTEAARLKARWSEIKRSGIVLREPEILEAMEQPPEGEPAIFIPSEQLSLEEFQLVRQHVDKVLDSTLLDFSSGVITADPYYHDKNDTACRYCPYFSACHFEEGKGNDHMRYLHHITKEEFLHDLEHKQ